MRAAKKETVKPTAVELPRLDNPKEISQVVNRTVAAKASRRNKSQRRDGLPRMATGKEINVMYPSVFLFNLHKKGCLQPWGDNQYVMHTVSTSSGLINSRICELTGRSASYRMATPFMDSTSQSNFWLQVQASTVPWPTCDTEGEDTEHRLKPVLATCRREARTLRQGGEWMSDSYEPSPATGRYSVLPKSRKLWWGLPEKWSVLSRCF